MNNAETIKELSNQNCLNCKYKKQFKSTKEVKCNNPDSVLVNKVTSGYLVCNQYTREEN